MWMSRSLESTEQGDRNAYGSTPGRGMDGRGNYNAYGGGSTGGSGGGWAETLSTTASYLSDKLRAAGGGGSSGYPSGSMSSLHGRGGSFERPRPVNDGRANWMREIRDAYSSTGGQDRGGGSSNYSSYSSGYQDRDNSWQPTFTQSRPPAYSDKLTSYKYTPDGKIDISAAANRLAGSGTGKSKKKSKSSKGKKSSAKEREKERKKEKKNKKKKGSQKDRVARDEGESDTSTDDAQKSGRSSSSKTQKKRKPKKPEGGRGSAGEKSSRRRKHTTTRTSESYVSSSSELTGTDEEDENSSSCSEEKYSPRRRHDRKSNTKSEQYRKASQGAKSKRATRRRSSSTSSDSSVSSSSSRSSSSSSSSSFDGSDSETTPSNMESDSASESSEDEDAARRKRMSAKDMKINKKEVRASAGKRDKRSGDGYQYSFNPSAADKTGKKDSKSKKKGKKGGSRDAARQAGAVEDLLGISPLSSAVVAPQQSFDHVKRAEEALAPSPVTPDLLSRESTIDQLAGLNFNDGDRKLTCPEYGVDTHTEASILMHDAQEPAGQGKSRSRDKHKNKSSKQYSKNEEDKPLEGNGVRAEQEEAGEVSAAVSLAGNLASSGDANEVGGFLGLPLGGQHAELVNLDELGGKKKGKKGLGRQPSLSEMQKQKKSSGGGDAGGGEGVGGDMPSFQAMRGYPQHAPLQPGVSLAMNMGQQGPVGPMQAQVPFGQAMVPYGQGPSFSYGQQHPHQQIPQRQMQQQIPVQGVGPMGLANGAPSAPPAPAAMGPHNSQGHYQPFP